MTKRQRQPKTRPTGSTRGYTRLSPLALLWIVTALLFYPSNAAKSPSTVWYEIRPTVCQNELDPDLSESSTPPLPRRLFWNGRYDEEMTWIPTTTALNSIPSSPLSALLNSQGNKNNEKPYIHPLRTNLWKLDMQWTAKRERRGSFFAKSLGLEFHPNGYCLSKNIPGDQIVGMGTWRIFPWGVWFTLQELDDSGVEYTFVAGLHLNPFGKQPKMMQGSVVRHTHKHGLPDAEQDAVFVPRKRQWFRRVVGTFSGEGMGVDMADFSYSQRGVGLTQ